MNPNEFSKATASTSNTTLPIASTSNLNNGNSNGEIKGEQMDTDMEEVEPEIIDETPKSKKELEQEKKDMELGELLEMMEEWKPIVSLQNINKQQIIL